jgi:hypothetical protein
MKEIKEIKCYHIVSEPGDGTRYDYLAIKEKGCYRFFPMESTFKFPDYIPIHTAFNKDHYGIVVYLAEDRRCNPFTVKECLRTIKEFEEKEFVNKC